MILETATRPLYPLTPHKSISRKLHVLKFQCLSGNKIAEGSFLLHPGSFFAVTEIEDSDETLVSFLAEDAENTVIMNIVCIYITVCIKNRFLACGSVPCGPESGRSVPQRRLWIFFFRQAPTGKHHGGYSGNLQPYPDFLYRNNH